VNVSIVATPALLLVQVPPGVVLLIVVICPWHITAVPVIGLGNGDTVTVVEITHEPGRV
jgi:hypothetical protein